MKSKGSSIFPIRKIGHFLRQGDSEAFGAPQGYLPNPIFRDPILLYQGSDFGRGDFLPRVRMKFCHYPKSSPFLPFDFRRSPSMH